MPSWDPAQYARFADDRARPGLELMARIPDIEAREIVDLGCGTGELTGLLARRFPRARTVGLDTSPDMLAKAASVAGATFVQGDIAEWTPPSPVDIVFTNAALHWLPDHATLFSRLFAMLRPGGVFACQMPNNHDEPSHREMRALAASPAWADKLRNARAIAPVASPRAYAEWLSPNAAAIDVWETRYWHVLSGEEPIVEWLKGTGLRPFLDRLDPAEHPAFLKAYADAIRPHYPRNPDGTTYFPFPRLFIVAIRRRGPP